MRTLHHMTHGQHSRRDSQARKCRVSVASHVGVMVVLGTLFTAKINPRWVSGGLPREGNP